MVAMGTGIEKLGGSTPADGAVLTPKALEFVADLQREFGDRRLALLDRRRDRQLRLDAGEVPGFLSSTEHVRNGDWTVPPAPADLQDRRVEITGPTDKKMVINALNSGARVFMADFEDANSPTWTNMIEGQQNLSAAIDRTLTFESPEGKKYELGDNPAVLIVRPRGWHLDERHLVVDGRPCSGSLFDFGLYLFHNAERLLARGSGPYYYLPKLESHEEARLWNDVFVFAQERLGLPVGTIRATVLVETILAAFEMDEILYELRDHIVGMNAGRWDYIFSIIKRFRAHAGYTLPDRSQVTMSVPFMRAYAQLLVKTCHRRGAFAMGGMAAFIPSRRDQAVNEIALAAVREDKQREAADGCDGTWVAHPDLVPVAAECFAEALSDRPNQLHVSREDVDVAASDLLDVRIEGGAITEKGLRNNISVGILYIESWLRGSGAVAINNLMEDAATAEISRSQIWQWVRTGASTEDGTAIDAALVRRLADEEVEKIRDLLGPDRFSSGRFDEAISLFKDVALADEFVEFLTEPAYTVLDEEGVPS